MGKELIFILLLLIFIGRAIYFNLKSYSTLFLLVSFYIVSIPFQLAVPLISPNYSTMAGTLNNKIYITIPILLTFILLPHNFIRKEPSFVKPSYWVTGLFGFITLSLINSNNSAIIASMAFAVFFAGNILFYNFLFLNLSKQQILKGVFDGLLFLTIFQFILSICFPLLNIVEVTRIFHDFAEQGATRMGNRTGAVGTFGHPGNLALFSVFSTTFFLSCVLRNINHKLSLIMIFMNIMTVILTYSRSAYLVLIVDVVSVFLIYNNANKAIFSVINIIKFIVPLSIILGWLIFYSPFSELFLQSDVNDQVDNRMVHWFMALDAFNQSPWIGVGVNTHLEYFSANSSLGSLAALESFFLENPIHNIHLIVLVETGVLGLIFWMFFLIQSVFKAKHDLAFAKNEILSMTHIGIVTAFFLYGLTGWAPFSASELPFFLFFSFFTIKFRGTEDQHI